LKRSIALAVLLFSPLLIGLVDQMAALAVPVTRTLTHTTTMTTVETEVETSTLYWTHSEISTVPTTRTTTFTTTATLMLPAWRWTTMTWTGTSTRTFWTTTTKLTTKTTTKTTTIHLDWPIPSFKLTKTTTSTYTTMTTVWTLRTSTTTSTFTGTTKYLVVIPVVIQGTVTTEYPTETLTTILSTSASTVTMADVGTQTYTYTLTVPYVTEEAPPTRACIIATAAHRSELAPEVQFFRDFRDNIVMSTQSGRSFMTVFNRWYYSFSPQVAHLISENNLLRNVVKFSLYPLVGALYAAAKVHSALAVAPELATVIAGFVAALLIGLFYVLPSIFLMSAVIRKRGRRD